MDSARLYCAMCSAWRLHRWSLQRFYRRFGEEGWRQFYACQCCGTSRVYGFEERRREVRI